MNIQTNGQEVAHGIDKLLDDLTVTPTKFRPNIGKLNVLFNFRQRMIKVMLQAKGNFTLEFEVDVKAFAKDPEAAFNDIRETVAEGIMAGIQRRHGERKLLSAVMKEMAQ